MLFCGGYSIECGSVEYEMRNITNLYILVTQKQFNWYIYKLCRMGINPQPWVKEKIAEQGYDNAWFKEVAIATVQKVKGLKSIDFRHIRNDLRVWTKKFYKEVFSG